MSEMRPHECLVISSIVVAQLLIIFERRFCHLTFEAEIVLKESFL